MNHHWNLIYETNNWSNANESSSLHTQFLCSFNFSRTVLLSFLLWLFFFYLCYSLKKNLRPGKLQICLELWILSERHSLSYQIFWICHVFIILCCNVSYFWVVLCCLNWVVYENENRRGRTLQCCWVHNSGVAQQQ